jgi:S1-C subfamily serine protease
MRTLAILTALLTPTAAWAQEHDPIIRGMESMVQSAVEKAEAFTVGIWVTRSEPTPMPNLPVDKNSPFRLRPQKAPVSGTILESDGYIITSYFNVNGKVKSIRVVLPDGKESQAKLVGYDETVDLALLKVDEVGLPVPEPSPISKLKVGSPIVALGRGPDARGITIATGVVSAHHRMEGRCIQTDAKMNYGNTGGPLVDAEGRLIGVSCRVVDRNYYITGQNCGIGFATTHDQLIRLVPELKKGIRVTRPIRAYMGIQGAPDEPEGEGARIVEVLPGGSAEAAGIKKGDIILEFGDARTRNFDELREQILKRKVGDTVNVKLRRGTEEKVIELTLGENPND